MLDVLATCAVPLPVPALTLLLAERMKRKTLEAYLGDVQWSILICLNRLGGSRATVPSYSDMVERMDGLKPKDESVDREKVLRDAEAVIERWLPKEESF